MTIPEGSVIEEVKRDRWRIQLADETRREDKYATMRRETGERMTCRQYWCHGSGWGFSNSHDDKETAMKVLHNQDDIKVNRQN